VRSSHARPRNSNPPASRRPCRVRPQVRRLEDRTTPAATPYFPPSYYLANPTFSAAGPTPVAARPLSTALDFLGSHTAALDLAAGDLASPIVTSQDTDTDTGVSHIYLRQQVNGLPVVTADFAIGVAPDGQVISAAGGFVTGLKNKLGATGTPWPGMIALDAVRAAAADLGFPLLTGPEFVDAFVGPVGTPITSVTISAPDVSRDPIPATLVYAPTPDGSAAEAWELVVRTPDGQHWYDMTVDASSGAVLSQADWIDNDNYRVIPPPTESPQDGGFDVVNNPADAVASPYGWQDTNGVPGPEFTDTRGNNVDAHLDRNADDVPDPSPGRPSGGANLDFSGFTFNPATQPTTTQNQDAAQVNLFYVDNLLHDVHYQYGFTEAAGNFQVNDYGRGGVGGDPVQADAQDGGGGNNADFATPPDGTSPRMEMELWGSTSPQRDSDFDDGVIIHEFGHGVSNRLTGGPANADALDATQSAGMGEGWSDFYALMLLQRPTDTQAGGYGLGTYLLGEPQTGTGLRRFPYSFDMTTDPLLFDAYGFDGLPSSTGVTRSVEVHKTGEIWASTLWDMNWLLIDKYGYDANLATGWSPNPGPAHAGNKLALRLVMDAMKLQPANPSFTQARDAILSADEAINGGADLYEIWAAFARRGLGQGSSSGASSSTAMPTISTALPVLIRSVSPAAGAIVPAGPAAYTVTVTSPIDPATLDASDFVVNGQPATGVAYTPGSTSATFTFATDPVAGNGPQTISIAAGAFARASDGSPVPAYSSAFDVSPLAITSVSPAAGSVAAAPLTTIDVNFNGAVDPASVQPGDLTIGGGTVTGFSLLNGNTTVRFTVSGLSAEQLLTVRLEPAVFVDPLGNPSAGFDGGTVYIDYGTVAFPATFQAVAPSGSLAYTASTSATVGFAGDTDSFTLNLDANQTLNLTATPDANLRPTITVTGPGTNQTVSASAAGSAAQISSVPVTSAGTYTVTVGGVGSSAGGYTLQAVLNQAQEAETDVGQSNDTPAMAQDLSSAFVSLGGGATAATVHGYTDYLGQAKEHEPDDTPATATPDSALLIWPYVYSLTLSGTISSATDSDYFNIGTLHAGDVVDISDSGAGSGRGTNPDTEVELYRQGSSTPVATNNDSGPGPAGGHDALIYKFTVPTTATYYVRAYRAAAADTGTYQIAVVSLLHATAPATDGSFSAEAEPNDSAATANDASRSWRVSGYSTSALGTIDGAGDADHFSYQLRAGDVLTLECQSTSGLVPQAALLDAAGNVLAFDDGSGVPTTLDHQAAIFAYRIPATGTYYLRVTGAAGSIGTYSAQLVLSTPVTLPTGPVYDYYSFDLTAGQMVAAVLKSPESGVHVALVDPNGVLTPGVTGATNVNEVVSNYVAPVTGTYYLRAGGAVALTDYQAAVVIGGAFDAEPNDSFATAQSLGGGTPVLGAISGSDDWFQIAVPAGGGLTASTATPGGGPGEFDNALDPAIELYDPAGALIAGDDNSAADGRNATLARTGLAAGTYRVRVYGAGGTAGEYVLIPRVTAPPQIAGIAVGDGTAQRSEVRSTTVTFSQPVAFAGGDANAAAAFRLRHVQTGNAVDLSAAVALNAQGQTVVTLTFAGPETDPVSGLNGGLPSLADGRYQLTVVAANVTGGSGLSLAGGQPNGNYVSPDDSFQGSGPHLYRLFGDASGDGVVDATDLGQFRSTFNANNGQANYLSFLDADNSGVVDASDLGQFRPRFNTNVFA
jgi:extracellular elastinolytic metalloproteinase